MRGVRVDLTDSEGMGREFPPQRLSLLSNDCHYFEKLLLIKLHGEKKIFAQAMGGGLTPINPPLATPLERLQTSSDGSECMAPNGRPPGISWRCWVVLDGFQTALGDSV